MKIVKEFYDEDYCIREFRTNWYWGLGDDGNLYRRCDSTGNQWVGISEGMFPITVNLRDMKLIVKEFGHLLVWL
jgi:hypothetical protein